MFGVILKPNSVWLVGPKSPTLGTRERSAACRQHESTPKNRSALLKTHHEFARLSPHKGTMRSAYVPPARLPSSRPKRNAMNSGWLARNEEMVLSKPLFVHIFSAVVSACTARIW